MTNRCKVHKVRRVKMDRNKYPVYKCIHCPAYWVEPLIIGQIVECWICGAEFKMTDKTLKLKPDCGCKRELRIEQTGSGAAMDDTKVKVLKIKPRIIDPELETVKSDLINHLLSKASRD
jgi:hypothetical protein